MKKTNPQLLLLAVFVVVSMLGAVCGLAEPAGGAPGGENSTTAKRIRVGGRIYPDWARLVFKANPLYPDRAKQAHIEGVVIFEIVISQEGTVLTAKLISGHPLLVQQAAAAVKRYRYDPPRYKGKLVEVITTATVNFSLP